MDLTNKNLFKYISCSYLSFSQRYYIRKSEIQIHLMFLFILDDAAGSTVPMSIQIHLMFLFIDHDYTGKTYPRRFKYISCSYLSQMWLGVLHWYIIQIHLMFLFIRIYLCKINHKVSFKYISCSYLSQNELFYFFLLFYSNTSHVLIYLLPPNF